jgi:periplasmic divalent cation tolerance protein
MGELCLAYVTASSKEQALAIGRALVEQRLAACINVLPGMTSVYRWQGEMEEGDEAVLIVKTERRLVDGVVAAVKKLHSYDVPCVLVLPVTGDNDEYLRWLRSELP